MVGRCVTFPISLLYGEAHISSVLLCTKCTRNWYSAISSADRYQLRPCSYLCAKQSSQCRAQPQYPLWNVFTVKHPISIKLELHYSRPSAKCLIRTPVLLRCSRASGSSLTTQPILWLSGAMFRRGKLKGCGEGSGVCDQPGKGCRDGAPWVGQRSHQAEGAPVQHHRGRNCRFF